MGDINIKGNVITKSHSDPIKLYLAFFFLIISFKHNLY